jgi:NAD(P)H-flavin reductase
MSRAARVESVSPVARDHVELVVSVDPERARAHERPGQFVTLTLPGVGSSPFAISSPPRPAAPRFHFLVKSGSELADALSALRPGSEVEIGMPEGKGFPLERAFGGRRLLLFATGSGISAIRSVLASIEGVRDRIGPVTLYYGARTPEAFAYLQELHAEEVRGLTLVRTVSHPGDSGWEGLTGYVQSHIAESPLGGAVAFLCGQSSMVKEVSQVLVQRGVDPGDIFLNY